jgi:hypothetical protein
MRKSLTRRRLLQSAAALAAARALGRRSFGASALPYGAWGPPLAQVAYSQVTVTSPLHRAQIENTQTVLAGISDDSLMKPFRMMAGQPAPGVEIGGWYEYLADYNYKTGDAGLSPGASFGQWTSAMARHSAATGDARLRERVLRLNKLYGETIVPAYYTLTRLPAYSLDKFVCGLKDSHALLGDPNAFAVLDKTTDAAVLALPGRPVDRDVPWLVGRDNSWNWDESPTLPENLYLAYALGAGQRYRAMAEQYLDNKTFFEPLARGENVLGGKHGYSYVNAMGSAMQAWMVTGSELHLRAALNGFDMLEQQSFATGGWAPDETLVAPGVDKVYTSLTSTHNNFEAPCCAYAHMKLTRYLLQVTREGRYGDSMERVMYNTVLGALPLEPDGRAFYFQDYNEVATRFYSVHRWPCCSGTLPQVAADYGINSYFQERDTTGTGAVWVNLYVPSVFRWQQGGTQLTLTQDHSYPDTGDIRLSITAPSDANFALRLRIPAWAPQQAVLLRVNGKPVPVHVEAGFTSISRTWQSGDTVELTLPMPLRLEPIPSTPAKDHSRIVALVRGPIVLFPLHPGTLKVRERDALAPRQTGLREWTIPTHSGAVRFVPYTEVGEATYSTYFHVT